MQIDGNKRTYIFNQELTLVMVGEEVDQSTGFDKVWSQLPHLSLYQLGITAAAGYTGLLIIK